MEWLPAWRTDWLTGWLNDYVTDWLTQWLNDWLNDWLTEWLCDWLTDWLNEWLTKWLADWLTDWMTEWLTDWLNDWLTINDWLTEGMIFRSGTSVFYKNLSCSASTAFSLIGIHTVQWLMCKLLVRFNWLFFAWRSAFISIETSGFFELRRWDGMGKESYSCLRRLYFSKNNLLLSPPHVGW